MIDPLKQPIDPAKIQAMNDEQKVELARQAYADFLHIAHEVGEHQKEILDKALKELENKKIDEVRDYIDANFKE